MLYDTIKHLKHLYVFYENMDVNFLLLSSLMSHKFLPLINNFSKQIYCLKKNKSDSGTVKRL